MTAIKIDIRDTVSRLLEVCKESESGFAAASRAVAAEEMTLKRELMRYSLLSRGFIAELESELGDMDEEVDDLQSIRALMRRNWMTAIPAAGSQRAAILEQCQCGVEAMLAAYQEARSMPLPSPLAEVIDAQNRTINRVYDRIELLHEAAIPNN